MADVRAQIDGAIGRIWLSQSDRLNAMTLDMWRELGEAVTALDADAATRAIVIRGEGSEAFSAGADISEFSELRATVEAAQIYSRTVSAALRSLLDARKPTVALIHGVCIGGGAGIAIACRLRFCDDALRFAIPAARLGVVYEREAIDALVGLTGPSRALDILLSGRRLTAAEALQFGLVTRVTTPDDLDDQVEDYVSVLADNAPLSMEGAIVAVRTRSAGPDDELEDLQRRAIESADYREGRLAFLEKRRPRFTGQ